PNNPGTHTGSIGSPGGTLLATATFTNETASGWQTVYFSQLVPVTAGQEYMVSYHTEVGQYSVTGGTFASAVTVNDLTVPVNGATYRYGAGGVVPTASSSANYWVDVVYAPI
ncbi:MAG TPA: DUF4082 domain-containing protein, partial [Micromonosporaceae bacterium]